MTNVMEEELANRRRYNGAYPEADQAFHRSIAKGIRLILGILLDVLS